MSRPSAPPALVSEFGKRVRALREQTGMSQEKLAFVCGFHRTYVGIIERGEVNPGLYAVLLVTTGLGVKPGELLDDLPPVELPLSPLLW